MACRRAPTTPRIAEDATDTPTLLISGLVLLLLGRSARVSWRHRQLSLSIWRAIRPRHVLGSVSMLAMIGIIVIGLVTMVPPLSLGLGTLVDFDANAVFTPLEQAADALPEPPATGPDWAWIGVATLFLGVLAALLPWLAFTEEEVFRAGLETAGPAPRLVAALAFGAAHLVMLIPIGAALGISVAGAFYGEVYRRAYRRAVRPPWPAVAAYRPTRRARTAAVTPSDRLAQAGAVHAAAVWHTTFNTLVIVALWVLIVVAAW